MSSRTRKVISGAICAFLLLMNMGVASYDPSTAAKDNSPTEETEQSEGEAVPSGDRISTDSSTGTGGSANEAASPDDGSISQGESDDLTDSGESISESQTEVGSSSEVDTTSDDALPEDYKALRMRDDVTDEFVRSFDSVADISLSEFSNGNHRGKVYAHCYGYSAVQSGYYFEILDTSAGKISVTVEVGGSTGDDNGKGSSGMRDVFRDVVKAIDPSVSDDEIYSYFDADPTGTDGDKIGGVEVFISREAELSGGHYYGYIRVTKL